ncbi:MAG: molecular chaperone TorD family protein [Chloroflexi bacterium]|nr:molecular chaperone TorD family protein [Chloroflexota bacterium]
MIREDRISLYRLLAQALAYPDEGFAGRIQESLSRLPLELWSDPDLDLSSLLRGLAGLTILPLEQLQGEHTRLFINAYPHVPCPPYESVYRDGELLGQAAEEMDVLCRRWGLSVDGEEVDHAGVELEFTSFLLTIGSPEAMATAEHFLVEHLRSWLPRFAGDMVRESRLGFYQAVGRLLAAVLEHGVKVAPA